MAILHAGKAQLRMRTWVKRLLATAAAAVAVFTVLYLEYQGATAPKPQQDADAEERAPEAATETIDWDYWRSVNPDVAAWVRIGGTAIDSPVVQAHAEDPEFYLSHDVNGEQSEYGCPYIDADCSAGVESANVVILGHHMNDGSMFADLANYHDPAFAEEHATIMLYTPDGDKELAATSSRTIPGALAAKRTDFVNKADFSDYKAECFDASDVQLVPRDVAVGPTRLYTFVTCSYFEHPDNERTLVYAAERGRP